MVDIAGVRQRSLKTVILPAFIGIKIGYLLHVYDLSDIISFC